MKTKRKNTKVVVVEVLLGFLLTMYVAAMLSTEYQIAGCSIGRLLTSFDVKRLTYNPLRYYYNSTTGKAAQVAAIVYIISILMYLSREKNFMPGREFGSSKWADVRQLDKKLHDERKGYNRILSQNLRLSLDGEKTNLNNHTLVIGGSGAGKSFYFTASNFLSLPEGSFVVTDPKGELLRNLGKPLQRAGYRIQVLNLLNPEQSDYFNPFAFLRNEEDVNELVENLIKNTTQKEETNSDPFWEKAEGLLMRCLIHYIRLEKPEELKNFRTFLDLMMEIKVGKGNEKTKLDIRMEQLRKTSELGVKHPAYRSYQKFISAAGDTMRSIIICAHSRFDFLDNESILRLLDKNTIDIAGMGNGVNNDGKTKTFTFCVIPDNKKIYNPIVGMLYTQMFNEFYYQADIVHDGKLPLHVTFWFDEFANVALPNDYCSLLTTMRSRNMSSVIIIQNIAQIKKLYGQDLWETIPGNCDTFVYLGGNEPSSHKYVVELLGKQTINKKSHGESKGQHGSASENVDSLGRDLIDQGEIRKLSRKECLILIAGEDPVIDKKYRTYQHMYFQYTGWKGHRYVHQPESKQEEPARLLSTQEIKRYQKLEKEGKAKITTISMGELLLLDEVAWNPPENLFSIKEKESGKRKEAETDSSSGTETIPDTHESDGDSITKRMSELDYTADQIKEVKKALKEGISEEQVLTWFLPEISAGEMKKMRSGN